MANIFAQQTEDFTNNLSTHALKNVFGDFSTEIRVGVNPNAKIIALNPRWSSVHFGDFRVPSFDLFRASTFSSNFSDTLASWALSTEHQHKIQTVFVPPETGRALLLPPSKHPIYRDILIKGTGLVERFVKANKLRDASRGFNGLLEISEAGRDLVNTELLERAGVLVSAGIGVVDHRRIEVYDDFTAWTGNYIRGYRVQTRISNLFDLDTRTMKAAVDDAITQMVRLGFAKPGISYAEYFRIVLEICARNVAIMQAIGFTQDSFHYGQVTLCGELTDFGIGNFKKPTKRGVVNTLHPWFRYERQPILMQNMLYKTHSVKAEPEPVLLPADSRSRLEQKTLFGAIAQFSPESVPEMEAMQPDRCFWEVYERHYRCVDVKSFNADVLNRLDDYYSWTPEQMLRSIPQKLRWFVQTMYEDTLNRLIDHYEKQEGSWERRGPTSIHKQVLFGAVARAIVPRANLNFSREEVGFSGPTHSQAYLRRSGMTINHEKDLSWKPNLIRS